VTASRAVSKSREIDSGRQRADSIPRPLRFQIAACERRCRTLQMHFDPENLGLPSSFAGFWRWLGGATDGETPLAAYVRTR